MIATAGGPAPALAAKAATTTIPIVFGSGGDPIQIGLVASLNRPGGNVTGVSSMMVELMPKRLGRLEELVPAATRFGVLVNPKGPNAVAIVKGMQSAAASRRPFPFGHHNVFRHKRGAYIEAAYVAMALREFESFRERQRRY